jgi:hypothetical protein
LSVRPADYSTTPQAMRALDCSSVIDALTA